MGKPDTPNDLLRRARLAQPSRSPRPGVLTQQELAAAVNEAVNARNGRMAHLDRHYISSLERGLIRWPDVARFFAHLDLVEPGLVQVHQWRPDPDDNAPDAAASAHGGVARKP